MVSVKWIEGDTMLDITDDILSAAIEQLEPEPVDHIAARFDHQHDVRKNWVM